MQEICCDGVPVDNLTAAAAHAKGNLRRVGHGEALVYVNECKNAFIGKSCEHPETQGNCTPVTCWHCGGREYPGWIKGKVPEGLDLISIDSYELGNISLANKTIGHTFAGHPWWLAEPLENQQFYKQVIQPKLWPVRRRVHTIVLRLSQRQSRWCPLSLLYCKTISKTVVGITFCPLRSINA